MDLISEELTKRTYLQHPFIKLFLKNTVLVVMDASAGPEETMFFLQSYRVNGMLQDCKKKSTMLSHDALFDSERET